MPVTRRAVFLGLGLVVVLGLVTYYNEAVLAQTRLINSYFPLSIFGLLLVYLLGIHPFLVKRLPSWAPSGAELAVIVGLPLVACSVAFGGFLQGFSPMLMMPHRLINTNPGWVERGLLDRVPDKMLANPGDDSRGELSGYIQGLKPNEGAMSWDAIPWDAWTETLSFWLPLVLALWIAIIGLSIVLNRQWSSHEHLPYPLVKIANSFLPGPGEPRAALFLNRLFWIGGGLVFLIHLNNYIFLWNPGFVEIPRTFDFRPVLVVFPWLEEGSRFINQIMVFRVVFAVIAISYFLPKDVSLGVGLSPYLFAVVASLFAMNGFSVNGGGYYSPERMFGFGAYAGLFGAVLFTGRYYYSRVFASAVYLRPRGDLESSSVHGAQVFLVGMLVFVAYLIGSGLDWMVALLFSGVIVVMYVTIARVVAETGVFMLQAYWLPAVVLTGLMGPQALGPQMILLMFIISIVILNEPGRDTLSPFVANALKLAEDRGVPVGRMAVLCGISLLVILVVALPVTMYFQYSEGLPARRDGSAALQQPALPFANAIAAEQRLESQGLLERVNASSTWDRVLAVSVEPSVAWSAAIGCVVFLAFAAARLRFPWWPLHPVFFLVWHTQVLAYFAASFLLGWFIKVLATKYGGERTYRALQPLMLGLIAGDILGGGATILIGWIYASATGQLPVEFLTN